MRRVYCVTVSVPSIPGCSVHVYRIFPALVGVNEYVPSLPKLSDENLAAPPVVVTLWSTSSLLTHVTFWPTLTVWSLGSNEMLAILIVVPPPPPPPLPLLLAGAGGEEVSEEPLSFEDPQP